RQKGSNAYQDFDGVITLGDPRTNVTAYRQMRRAIALYRAQAGLPDAQIQSEAQEAIGNIEQGQGRPRANCRPLDHLLIIHVGRIELPGFEAIDATRKGGPVMGQKVEEFMSRHGLTALGAQSLKLPSAPSKQAVKAYCAHMTRLGRWHRFTGSIKRRGQREYQLNWYGPNHKAAKDSLHKALPGGCSVVVRWDDTEPDGHDVAGGNNAPIKTSKGIFTPCDPDGSRVQAPAPTTAPDVVISAGSNPSRQGHIKQSGNTSAVDVVTAPASAPVAACDVSTTQNRPVPLVESSKAPAAQLQALSFNLCPEDAQALADLTDAHPGGVTWAQVIEVIGEDLDRANLAAPVYGLMTPDRFWVDDVDPLELPEARIWERTELDVSERFDLQSVLPPPQAAALRQMPQGVTWADVGAACGVQVGGLQELAYSSCRRRRRYWPWPSSSGFVLVHKAPSLPPALHRRASSTPAPRGWIERLCRTVDFEEALGLRDLSDGASVLDVATVLGMSLESTIQALEGLARARR
ncbi:MAG: hypothetical protein GY767_20260, partial [Shimia sp.]|nr:hypothetical protein [Shimia sp.]